MSINLKKICRDVARADEDIRMVALTTIGQLTGASVEDPGDLVALRQSLARAVEDSNPDVVFLARKALNHVEQLLGSLPPNRLPAGMPPAASPSDPPREGRDALERDDVLAGLAVEEDPTALASLVSQMRRVCEPVDLELAIPMLQHADARVRSNAVEAIEKLADEKRRAELLTPLLADENNRVRGNVAKALGRMGIPKIARYLEEMLRSPLVSMRESAVYAISHIRGAAMVDLLIKALRDPYEGIRLRALRGLKMHNDERAIPHVRPLLNDLDIDVCEEAHKAIKVIRKDLAPTLAGEMFDIEQLAARDERKKAEEDALSIPALAPADELSVTTGATTTGAMSRKKHAELLQQQADDLLSRTASVPKLDLSGRSRMELEGMLAYELAQVGQAVFKCVRASEISHQRLSLLYYDVLKFQATLKRHQERGQAPSREEGGFLGALKAKISGKPAENDPVARIERRIEQALTDLGRQAVNLVRDGAVELPGNVNLERVSAIESRLRETAESQES